MQRSNESLIGGLDPAGLLGLGDTTMPTTGPWTPPSIQEVTTLFPQWEVKSVLGRGGMGAVYLARQPDLDREVAIKLLPIESSAEEQMVERFRREARTLAKLRHPGIVSLYEAGVTNAGHFYFVMEYIRGRPLSDLIHAGRLSTAQVIEIIRQVCDALAYAHSQGVVHRDIKPSNVLIDDQGNAHVADFGLARADSPTKGITLSQTGAFMGTPEYAAPEQAKDAAHVDHRADIYSLGVLLYEMLTGELPRGVFQPPSTKAGADARFDKVVNRALQERPEDRYQRASELKKDITTKRSGGLMWPIVVGVLVIAGWAVWSIWPGSPKHVSEVAVVESSRSVEAPQAPAPSAPPLQSAFITRVVTPTKVEVQQPPTAPMPKPVPAPVVSLASTPKAWSLGPVPPALLPPSTFFRQKWRDVALIESGGVVLFDDGKLGAWGETRVNETITIPADGGITQLAASASHVAALGADKIVYGIPLSIREGPGPVVENTLATFASPASKLPGITATGQIIELEPQLKGFNSLSPLPPEGAIALTMTSEGELWLIDKQRQLLRFRNGTFQVQQTPKRISTLGSTGVGVLVLTTDGEVLALDGAPQPAIGKVEAKSLITVLGHAAVVDSANKVHVWGPAVEDAPQRFSMPDGHNRLTISPRGVIVTWSDLK